MTDEISIYQRDPNEPLWMVAAGIRGFISHEETQLSHEMYLVPFS